jgi:hypothetical protein
LSSNFYLIPLYVSILVAIFHVSAFRILDILSSSLDALVTDSVCNLIPRTVSLVSCPLGTMKDDMAVGTGNGRICRLSCLFSRVMSGRRLVIIRVKGIVNQSFVLAMGLP